MSDRKRRQSSEGGNSDRDSEKTAIFIQNLQRPYTVLQLQTRIKEYGEFADFWQNRLKSLCVVEFENPDHAYKAYKEMDKLQWPETGKELAVRLVNAGEAKKIRKKEQDNDESSKMYSQDVWDDPEARNSKKNENIRNPLIKYDSKTNKKTISLKDLRKSNSKVDSETGGEQKKKRDLRVLEKHRDEKSDRRDRKRDIDDELDAYMKKTDPKSRSGSKQRKRSGERKSRERKSRDRKSSRDKERRSRDRKTSRDRRDRRSRDRRSRDRRSRDRRRSRSESFGRKSPQQVDVDQLYKKTETIPGVYYIAVDPEIIEERKKDEDFEKKANASVQEDEDKQAAKQRKKESFIRYKQEQQRRMEMMRNRRRRPDSRDRYRRSRDRRSRSRNRRSRDKRSKSRRKSKDRRSGSKDKRSGSREDKVPNMEMNQERLAMLQVNENGNSKPDRKSRSRDRRR